MIAGLSTVAVADTVYKWLDTSGQVHYTDRPPEGTAGSSPAVVPGEFRFRLR